MAFLGKRVTDIKTYLREAQSTNTLKYVPTKGDKDFIFIPYETMTVKDENGEDKQQNVMYSFQLDVHDWRDPNGQFHSCACLTQLPYEEGEDGKVINDGTCPFCDRVRAGWDIYRYRTKLEEENCKLTDKAREDHLKECSKTFLDERKAKEANKYLYTLCVQFRIEKGRPVLDDDNLPVYDFRVLKWSDKRASKVEDVVVNYGMDMAGAEIIFSYPNVDDRRAMVSQSAIIAASEKTSIIQMYPKVKDKILAEAKEFNWDSVVKVYPEWKPMSNAEAKRICDNMFEKWDEYNKRLETDANAKYLEYVNKLPETQPSLAGDDSAEDKNTPKIAPAVDKVPDINELFGNSGDAPNLGGVSPLI